MKLTCVISAKVVWLLDINLINPTGLSPKSLLEGIRDRYGFAKAPAHMHDRNEKNALSFEQGEFVNSKGTPILISLTVFNDGIVAESVSSTNDAMEFLQDLSLFIPSLGFSFPPPQTIAKGFTSLLQVECDAPLLSVNSRLERIIRFIESRLTTMDGNPRKYEVAALNFWSEDLSKNYAPSEFKFERKIGLSFSSNQYFSRAPLQTFEHLELLDELEKLLAS